MNDSQNLARKQGFLHALLRARRHWPLFIPALFVASVYHAWLWPGLITGEDFLRPDPSVLATYFPWPGRWAEFEYTGYSLAYWSPFAPLWSFAGALGRAGLGWEVIERVVWLFPLLVLAVLGPYTLAYRLTRSPIGGAVAASFFAINTWTIGLTERGHIPSLIAYSIMPLIVLVLLRFYEQPSPLRALQLAALATLQVNYDVRYTYITFLVVGLLTLSRWRSFSWRRIKPVVVQSGNALLFWTIFNLYWLFPLLFYPLELPPEYTQLASFVGQSSFENLPHAVAMFFPFYHHATATDPFKIDPVEPWFYAVPALVIASLAATWRRRWTPPLAVIVAVGVAVLAGPMTLLGFFDRFLFVYMPGMIIFRDVTKFSSLVALAYAMALSFGAARLMALARLRGWFRGGPSAVAALAIVAAAYVGLMHDAYNPRRFSNFAPLPVQAQDVQLKRFLDAQPGYFRTAFYPTSRPYFVGTDRHPTVNIGEVVNAPAYRGLALLSPKVSDPFALWRSPLAPAFVRQMNVRYFVIYDDPTGWVYRPFQYNVQRAEAQAFFAAQPWLRQVTRFGNNIVYRVVGASDTPAFIAPTPLLYDGTVKALDALVGTPLWSDRGTLILSSQVDRHAVLPLVRSVVRGPDAFDPRRPEQCPECDEADRRTVEYTAVALSRPAIAETMFGPPNHQQFMFRFKSAGSDSTSVQLAVGTDRYFLGTRASAPSVDVWGRDELFAIGSNAERVDLGDPRFVSSPVKAPGPGLWLAISTSEATVGIVNPSPWRETVDLVFPGLVSPDNGARRVRFALAAESGVRRVLRELRAPSQLEATLTGGGPWVTLHDVSLRPGVTWLDVSAIGPRHTAGAGANQSVSLLVRADIQLANERFDRSAIAARDHAPVLEAVRWIDLSLALHPRLWLHFSAATTEPIRLVLALENLQTHANYRVTRILRPQDQVDGKELSPYVQSALDTMFVLEPERYGAPLAAYLGDSVKGPLESSAYAVRDAWVESLASDGTPQPRVSEFIIGIGPADLPPWLPQRSLRAADARELAGIPLVAVDGTPYASKDVAFSPLLGRIVARLHLRFTSDSHLIEGLSEKLFGVQTALLSDGRLRPADGAAVRDYRELSGTEYTGTLRTKGGLLVWPVTYDEAWAVALVPTKGPETTGNVIVDWWRLRKYFAQPDHHVPANTLFNGWFVPQTNGRVVFIYVADVFSRLAALLWALLSTAVVAFVLLRRRRTPWAG